MCKKWIRTSELAAFEAITFTGTFGPLLWEKFYCVRGCCLYSLLKKFRALNFRGLGQQRNFFNNENFPIYGIYICIYISYVRPFGPEWGPPVNALRANV